MIIFILARSPGSTAMAVKFANRVVQSTTSTGTGIVVPSGTFDRFVTFAASFAPGDHVGYFILASDDLSMEVGTAPWTGTGIDRADPSAVVETSTNGGQALDLPVGLHTIACDATAATLAGLAEGDMAKLIYDPRGFNADTFLLDNLTGNLDGGVF